MENIPRNLAKELKRQTTVQRSRRKSHWTMILMNDRGRMLTFMRFKGMVIAIMITLALLICTTVGSGILSKYFMALNQNLSQELNDARKTVATLQRDQEVLVTQLALCQPEKPRPAKAAPPATPAVPVIVSSTDTGLEAVPVPGPGSTKVPPATSALATVVETPNLVSIDDFKILYSAPWLRVQFNILNQVEGAESVSGYTFVVLEAGPGDDGLPPLVLPVAKNGVALKLPAPEDFKSGQYFSISRFKPVSFRIKPPADPHRYKTVYILVYADDGRLINRTSSPVMID